MRMKAIFPESYSTVLCAKRMSAPFCEAAESKGLSLSLCSYGRCIMGMMYMEDGSLGAMPPPDLLIADNTICDANTKMWEVVAHYFGAPLYLVNGATRFTPEVEKD